MRPMITGIIIGVVSGILVGLLLLFLTAPKLMFREDQSTMDFDTTVAELEKAIEEKGWKTPAIHDLQATLHKFGKNVENVKVLEICNPDHSFEILSRDEEKTVSSMMPCRISVYEKEDGSVWISRMNSGIIAKPMSRIVRKTMTAAANDVEDIVANVLQE